MAQRYYRAVLERGEPGTGISVFFPDFLGCTSHGEDEQHAATQAAEALALHIEGMVQDGEALPEPSGINDPLPDWTAAEPFDEVGRVLVPVEVPGRAVRTNITLDEGLLARLDRAAAEEGDTRSGYIAAALRGKMQDGGGGQFRVQFLESTGKRLLKASGKGGGHATIRSERFEAIWDAFARMQELIDDKRVTSLRLAIHGSAIINASDLPLLKERVPAPAK